MTPNQHTMLNRLVEKIASVPGHSHNFVTYMNRRRNKNPYIKLSTDELRRLISLYNKLLEQGLVENLDPVA